MGRMGLFKPRGAAAFVLLLQLCLWVSVRGITDSSDVTVLNSMYGDLQSDSRLTKWVSNGGDPCGDGWSYIGCTGSSVTSLQLSNLGLNGKLQGWYLQNLQHVTMIDFSYNNLGNGLPEQFPPNLTRFVMNNNQFTGGFPYELSQIPSLTVINLGNNQLTGNLNPQLFITLTNLVTLDVSNNQIEGPLPDSVGDMTALVTLNLQNNKLNGQLPATLANLTNLQTLDISNNNFTGAIPAGVNPTNFSYGGNSLTGPAPAPTPSGSTSASPPPPPPSSTQPTPTSNPPSSSGSTGFFSTAVIAGLAAAGAVLLLLIAGLVRFCFFRNRHDRRMDEEANANSSSRRSWFMPLIPPGKAEKQTKLKVFQPATLDNGEEEQKVKAQPPVKSLKAPPSFKGIEHKIPLTKTLGKVNKSSISATAFSVADLQEATNSFAQENLIGEGNLGRVYRAEFPNGQVLAVKKLDSSASTVHNEDDFLATVDSLARLKQSNTTELVGYCVEHDQRLLVYEYISRGTLNELLHSSLDNTKGLSWNVRVKIALGSARALEYLHEVCAPPVVHRNFKSANILLDDELNPHVSDCGLLALSPSGTERQVSTQMMGSFGYSAPEYSMSGTYTVKSDVYSFGVVMLELLTGRKPLDSSRPRSEQSLVRWATPQLHDIDALARMVDPALKGIYPAKSLSRFADIVALCVQPEPEFRPPMSEVVQALVRLMQRASLSKRNSEVGTSADAPESSL